jgi:hypothetical protein
MCHFIFYLVLLSVVFHQEVNAQWTQPPLQAIYYSPSIIGQDPHEREIDIYTDFFNNLHVRDLALIKEIGATHVVVSENWADDGTNEHLMFMKTLEKYRLFLIVTFAIPMQNDPSLRDSSKSAFKRLVTEFYDPFYASLLWGFSIPVPDLDKMSEQDVEAYYALINELQELNQDGAYNPKNRPNITAGFPLNSRDGTVPAYFKPPTITPDFWSLDIYGGTVDTLTDDFLNTYFTAFGSGVTPLPYIVTLKTTSLNQSISDESYQVSGFNHIYAYVNSANTQYGVMYGYVFYEFSDEWWRSDLSTGGYDVEGCPNSNPYAHTACGITTYFGPFALEYSGLFYLRDIPLGYCIVPKLATLTLMEIWNPAGSMTVGKPICVGITQIVPYLVYPILVGCCILVFALLLVLPAPTPPKIIDRQLQYFADDDLERTHFMDGNTSVNGGNIPVADSTDNIRINPNPTSSNKIRAPNTSVLRKSAENEPLLITKTDNSIKSRGTSSISSPKDQPHYIPAESSTSSTPHRTLNNSGPGNTQSLKDSASASTDKSTSTQYRAPNNNPGPSNIPSIIPASTPASTPASVPTYRANNTSNSSKNTETKPPDNKSNH